MELISIFHVYRVSLLITFGENGRAECAAVIWFGDTPQGRYRPSRLYFGQRPKLTMERVSSSLSITE